MALLVKWNRTYNLTAIRAPLAMVGHHLLDSLAVLPHLRLRAGGRLADAGSGAGLPGIPLAIARPDWRVTLAEASQKKAAFLRQAVLAMPMVAICYPMIIQFQAMRKVKEAMISSLLRKGLLDLPLLFLMDALIPLYGCVWVQPIVDTISLIAVLFFYARLQKEHASTLK
jgi:O-antigen/teichoic acid export membrane protein